MLFLISISNLPLLCFGAKRGNIFSEIGLRNFELCKKKNSSNPSVFYESLESENFLSFPLEKNDTIVRSNNNDLIIFL